MNNVRVQCQAGPLELGTMLPLAQCIEATGCWALGPGKAC